MDVIDNAGEIILSESDTALQADSYLIRVGPFRFGSAGLEVEGKPDFNTCSSAVTTLKAAHQIVQLALGDLLNYMQARFGEAYSQVLDGLDYTTGTAANVQWVARSVPPEVRRLETLSYNHHAAVAPLPVEEQVAWLDLAEKQNLTVRQLRGLIHKPMLPRSSNGKAVGEVDHTLLRVTIQANSLAQIDAIVEATRGLVDWG